MALDIYTPMDLYAVMYDERMTVETSFFLDTYFPGSYFSTQEEILFDKISTTRKIAPFMLPNEQGKPIYRREGEKIQSFKPAYTKPKDAVRPSEMLQRQPGELVRRNLLSPKARYDAEVLRIAQYHRNSINRLWDFMAAKALLDGKITINYSRDAGTAYPSVVVDFGRDAAHTQVLGAGTRWGDAGVSIMDYVQSKIDLMSAAEFGGMPNRLVLGALAAVPFRKDPEIKELMNNNYRGSPEVNINRGLIAKDVMQPATMIGKLSDNLEVWVYTGTFQNDDNSVTSMMDPRDILLTAPGVEGIKAFGAILDEDAGLNAQDIFSKMWKQEDPSARFIMSQSAPLMIPVNPNRTFRARVVA